MPNCWSKRARFVDAQHRGPYRAWWHEHHFRADGDRTIMEDRVYYAPPLGGPGARVHVLLLVLVVANLVSGFQALGTLMAVGLMMLPAASARFWVVGLPALSAVAAGILDGLRAGV